LLAHPRRTANTNAPNPWYEQLAVVYYHWFRVGNASECAEQALSERQPALLRSSDRPRVGLYGAQKWPLRAQLVEKTAQGWSMYLSVCLVGRVARLVSILAVYDRLRVFFNALSHEKATFLSLGLVVAPVRLEYWGNLH